MINDTLLTIDPDTCSLGIVGVGHSSVPKKVSYSAYNLTENPTVTATPPFEVSLDKIHFGNVVALNLYEGQFYIRYSPMDTGLSTSVITLSSQGINNMHISVNGEATACDNVVATFPYTMDFTTDPPLCWDLLATNDVTWQSNYFYKNSYWASCRGTGENKIDQYETTVYDFSQSHNMVMTFDFLSNYYYVSNSNVDFKIYVSKDGGNTYITTPIWKLSDFGSFEAWTNTTTTINLRNLEGESNVKFKVKSSE